MAFCSFSLSVIPGRVPPAGVTGTSPIGVGLCLVNSGVGVPARLAAKPRQIRAGAHFLKGSGHPSGVDRRVAARRAGTPAPLIKAALLCDSFETPTLNSAPLGASPTIMGRADRQISLK